MSYANVFSLFCGTFSAGVVASLPWVPVREIGGAYFRANALLALVFALFAGFLAPGEPAAIWFWTLAAGLAVYVALVSFAPGTGSQILLGLLAVLGAAAATRPAWEAGPRAVADLASSGLLSGSILVTMILGHWYLVVPGLAFDHLKRLTLLFAGALAARAAIEGAAFFAAVPVQAGAMDFVFALMRYLFGILAPGVMAWMVWECLKLKSNQSATGILYAISALVLIGEIAAHLLKAGSL